MCRAASACVIDCRSDYQYLSDSYFHSGADTYFCPEDSGNFLNPYPAGTLDYEYNSGIYDESVAEL